MSQVKEWFDFSDYPKDHPLYDESNKKVIGKFKDELNGKIMEEGVFLKPKQYAFSVDGEEKKKSKGIKKNICAIETQVNAELESVKAEIAELKDKGSAYMQKYETASEHTKLIFLEMALEVEKQLVQLQHQQTILIESMKKRLSRPSSRVEEEQNIIERVPTPMEVEKANKQIEKQEMEAFRASPAYVYWVEKIYPRVLYTYSCGFKRCVIPFFRDFGLTYRHGQHKNLVIGDKIMIYAERNKNFGEPFEASVVDFDDSLDVALLKAPDGRVFTSENFYITVPKEGSHYIMIGFSNTDAPTVPRISLGSVTTIAYEAFGEVRFYGSSGCSNGDSGSGCYDRYGRLIGINVAMACTPVHVVESTSAVQLIGGKNAITPAIAIFVQFKKYLPVIEKKHIIE